MGNVSVQFCTALILSPHFKVLGPRSAYFVSDEYTTRNNACRDGGGIESGLCSRWAMRTHVWVGRKPTA